MPTYTGPVPPTPTASSTDAQWQNWWAYQGVLRDLRYEDERVAAVRLAAERAVLTDRQHGEKMLAEAACAAATTKAAEAQVKAAEAMLRIHTTPPAEGPEKVWTDEQLVRQFMFNMADTADNPTEMLGRAKTCVRLLRLAFQPTQVTP